MQLVGLRHAGPAEFDFGWPVTWTVGPLAASVVALALAIALQWHDTNEWPLALVLCAVSISFFTGHLIALAAGDVDHAVLPMVGLLSTEADRVLDAGCGSGRTTIALARVARRGQVVAVDRFDASYIDGGGESLLRRNLALAKLQDRVEIRKADLLRLPFADESFDSAASAHVFDHLGAAKLDALKEMKRVLKPGGRFLLVVWIPSWTMFAVCNLACFAFLARPGWRALATEAGLAHVEEGRFNGMWYLLLEKAPCLNA
ncbi:class I SAM-dependent methyltransferase [Piscinibacter terrae]|nr:class I SAM-dependent methyltransferase [Albitalea terrae]